MCTNYHCKYDKNNGKLDYLFKINYLNIIVLEHRNNSYVASQVELNINIDYLSIL